MQLCAVAAPLAGAIQGVQENRDQVVGARADDAADVEGVADLAVQRIEDRGREARRIGAGVRHQPGAAGPVQADRRPGLARHAAQLGHGRTGAPRHRQGQARSRRTAPSRRRARRCRPGPPPLRAGPPPPAPGSSASAARARAVPSASEPMRKTTVLPPRITPAASAKTLGRPSNTKPTTPSGAVTCSTVQPACSIRFDRPLARRRGVAPSAQARDHVPRACRRWRPGG